MKTTIALLCFLAMFSPLFLIDGVKEIHPKQKVQPAPEIIKDSTVLRNLKSVTNWKNIQRPRSDNFFFGFTEAKGWSTYQYSPDGCIENTDTYQKK